MAENPHAYVVRLRENADEYAQLSQRIGKEGVTEEWKDGRRYRYWYAGGFKYWQMGQIINRAKARA